MVLFPLNWCKFDIIGSRVDVAVGGVAFAENVGDAQ